MDNALRRFRKDQKLSVRELGEKLGISRSSVSRIELGQQNVSLTTAQKIMTVTGGEVTANDLVASLIPSQHQSASEAA